MKESTYQLIQEWIVDHTNDWDTFYSKSDRSTDHRISMDLLSVPCLMSKVWIRHSAAKRGRERGGKKEEGSGTVKGRERGGHTKLVVPSIGLLSAPCRFENLNSLLDWRLARARRDKGHTDPSGFISDFLPSIGLFSNTIQYQRFAQCLNITTTSWRSRVRWNMEWSS